ncbi:hypothetical protein [Cytobacillus firmus]|uniref:hypothetical protein n=1 Tax=Cytobacillus firmus TaxID=1399 RepID=UPI001CFD2506|nr:hypothetical protein [Cytobacillus firmus]
MRKTTPISEKRMIQGTDKSIKDFWKWGFSDLLSNSLRGIFAEFLVGTALGCLNDSRKEWDSYDLIYRGKKIEVKSAAYIQSWFTDKYSTINFNIGAKREYDFTKRRYSTTIKRNADVYVFCLLKEKDVENLDPLNICHWEFYIVLTKDLDEHFPEQKTISLASLNKLRDAFVFEEIRERMDKVLEIIS